MTDLRRWINQTSHREGQRHAAALREALLAELAARRKAGEPMAAIERDLAARFPFAAPEAIPG